MTRPGPGARGLCGLGLPKHGVISAAFGGRTAPRRVVVGYE
ncbi:hypothetical protein [Amycolatopsis sp. NPDC059021]